jgi:hypothetical protein
MYDFPEIMVRSYIRSLVSRISDVRVYHWHSPTGLPNHELSARKVNEH